MEARLNKKEHKWTNTALVILTLAIIAYVGYVKGFITLGTAKIVELETSDEIIALNVKEKSTIGLNEKQVYEVTSDGITSYNLAGEEIWQDTFSMPSFVVKQRTPYIAVGSKQGKSVILFNEKGKQIEITTANPIVYFSINESGGSVTVQSEGNAYTVTAYDTFGQAMCQRTSFISDSGYPLAAELSPDNKLLLISYVSVDEPQVVSRIVAIDVEDRNSEKLDNIKYGYKQSNNLIYDIEFISKETWVSIGDQSIDWYDLEGNHKGKQSNLSPVFTPYLTQMSQYGLGYLPVVLTEKPTQNVVHRQDKLVYYDHTGKETFSVDLDNGVTSYGADENGVTLQIDNTFKGYNKMGNLFFEYTSSSDIDRVIYNPSLRKGIAVSKEKVFLLVPKKEKN